MLIRPEATDFTKAVELPPVSIEVEVTQADTCFRRQLEWRSRWDHSVDRMKVDERFLKPQKIVGGEATTDVDVLRRQGDAVSDRGKPSDDDELNPSLDETVEQ